MALNVFQRAIVGFAKYEITYLKACSTCCSENTVVWSGLTAPFFSPSLSNLTTAFLSGSSDEASNSESKRIPWNVVFFKNTDMPVKEKFGKSSLKLIID